MDKKTLRKILVGKPSLRRLIRSTIIIYGCLLVFAFGWSDRIIFRPHPASYQDSPEIIKIDSGSGQTVSAQYLVNAEADYTVLYNHGNAVDLGDMREFMEQYRSNGFSVFSYDYRGYGTTPGRPTTGNACRDAETVLKYLVEQRGIPLDRIIVHGRSVGGGLALYLAHKHDVAGVIVESSFVTAFRVVTRVPLAPFDKLRNITRIGEVNCPVLVIHGRNDTTIPFWHGERLFRKATEPKMSCWLDGTHSYMSVEDEIAYWKAISSFVESLRSNVARVADTRMSSSGLRVRPEWR